MCRGVEINGLERCKFCSVNTVRVLVTYLL